jgi:hypothetical protein
LYGAETWILWEEDEKYVESFEMCWRRMEKISWTDRVGNKEVLHTQGGEEYPTYSKKAEGKLDWSHLAYTLLKKI